MSLLCVLNCFNRPFTHSLQVQAIKAQSLKPDRIVCLLNKPTMAVPKVERQEGVDYVDISWNSFFHFRFAMVLGIPCEWVSVFDCDTIPCPNWLQNCWDHKDLGILGGSGVRLQGPSYRPHYKFGWNGIRSTSPERVDLVGHAWFMSKDHVRYLFEEEPITYENGEDIQLGYLADRHDVTHWVPPHPINDVSVWANHPKYANLGTTDAATWRSKGKASGNHYQIRDDLVKAYCKRGWRLTKDAT